MEPASSIRGSPDVAAERRRRLSVFIDARKIIPNGPLASVCLAGAPLAVRKWAVEPPPHRTGGNPPQQHVPCGAASSPRLSSNPVMSCRNNGRTLAGPPARPKPASLHFHSMAYLAKGNAQQFWSCRPGGRRNAVKSSIWAPAFAGVPNKSSASPAPEILFPDQRSGHANVVIEPFTFIQAVPDPSEFICHRISYARLKPRCRTVRSEPERQTHQPEPADGQQEVRSSFAHVLFRRRRKCIRRNTMAGSMLPNRAKTANFHG